MKRASRWLGLVLVVLLLLSLVLRWRAPSLIDAARDHLASAGVTEESLRTADFTHHIGFGGTEKGFRFEWGTVRFRGKEDADEELTVELSRPVWFVPWRVEKDSVRDDRD